MTLIPKNWESFQHYKNRNPPWIKLHKTLLDDCDFQSLPVASRALAPMLWLLASEQIDGVIRMSLDVLAFRLRSDTTTLANAMKPLINKGFFDDTSNTLAPCDQDAMPEKSREEKETETDNSLRSPEVAAKDSKPAKKNKLTPRYTKQGFSDRAVNLAFIIKDDIAVKVEPEEPHRPIRCDMSRLCQRLDHILALDAGWEESVLIQAFQDYLKGRTKYIKAPQNFFTMTTEPDGDPPWLPYAMGVITQRNSRQRPLPSSEGTQPPLCQPITVSDEPSPGSAQPRGQDEHD